jgi:Hypothetical protein (DUF2513)
MNLIRELLLFYEGDCQGEPPATSTDAREEHLIMLIEAGLLSGKLSQGSQGSRRYCHSYDGRVVEKPDGGWMVYPVTWDGHEFLAASRDESLWKKALKVVGNAAMPVIMAYLQDQAMRALNLRRN